MRDRVDHPRKGSKDLADAVCGSIYNAISRTKFSNNEEINIHTYESMSYEQDFKKEDGEIKKILEWKWMAAGGILVLAWLFSHINFDMIAKIFG
jgi:hypothetical protein